MANLEDTIASLDVRLFDAVPSQTCREDRESLLRLQRCIRRTGSYVYLEIGSHLGGTLQPHLVDSRCSAIYSIDKRPLEQPDELLGVCHYPENSTKRMLSGLQQAFPEAPVKKIKTFDADARELDPRTFIPKPDFCFIDGEHTDQAVCSDFDFCLKACNRNGIIGFHDANFVVGGLAHIKRQLTKHRIVFRGILLPKNVYVILLNDAIQRFADEIQESVQDEVRYMRKARWVLLKARISRRRPGLQKAWHAFRRLLVPR
jgi:Methyltransferase domain